MEIILFILLAGAGVAFGVLQSRQRLQGWEDAAASCGLQVEEASGWGPELKARAGQVEVRIGTTGNKGRLTRIEVVAPGSPGFHSVTIRPELLLHWVREIEIGDDSFDSAFIIEGPARLVFALLDAEMRRLLLGVKDKSGVEISQGELRADMSDEKVPDVLPLLLDIRKRLVPQMDLPRRLAENANQDPVPGVRLQNLLLLIRELPKNPGTAEALRKACSDRSPEIRLRAAKEMGAEGRGVLLELAENPADDAVSAEALSILDRELPFERVNAILDLALSRRHPQTARVCLEAIGRSGDTAAVDVLAKVLERKESELALTAAQALGATGSPAAEPPLIAALQRDQEGLQAAAAQALGRVGSVAAVLPLKETADRFLLGEIRRSARQAIAEIQSRVQGASPGQLSLAGAEAGQLSLAQGEAGQLSLAADPAGQLSLPPEEQGRLSKPHDPDQSG